MPSVAYQPGHLAGLQDCAPADRPKELPPLLKANR